jgi:hypothetical protein
VGWRDEIDVVLQEWIATIGGEQGGQRWRRIGAAHKGEPGQYVVDIRSANLSPDQIDEMRLAGPDVDSVAHGFPVIDAVFAGESLQLRVAEHAKPPEPHLWRLQQEPAFLVKTLRDGLAQLSGAGLANLLAQGQPGGRLSEAIPPPGLENGQEDAYRACRGEGLWLVWGPPGTGKTRVLRSAIGDLLKDGKRVLLVSGTNVAVDNALLAVLKERRFDPGEIVRVGPPQLREIADNPDISLPLMVRAELAQVEEQRQEAAKDLLAMDTRQERLKSLNERLAGFNPDAYNQAVARLGAPGGSVREIEAALTETQAEQDNVTRALERARAALATAQAAVDETGPFRALWTEVRELEAGLTARQQDAAQAESFAQLGQRPLAGP